MKWFSCIALFCAVASAPPAVAQYVGTTAPLFPTLIVPMFPGGTTVPFSGQSSRRARSAQPVPTKGSTLANGAAQIDPNAVDLATHFPPDARAKMKTIYVQSFGTFKAFERKLNLPDNDVANAVSAYIGGNYMVLHQTEIADPDFLKMVTQIRTRLLQSPGFQQVSEAQKRKLYEQTAMVGMFMAVAQLSAKTTPQSVDVVHNLQDSAKANLELVLGKPAANLRIDSEGMHL